MTENRIDEVIRKSKENGRIFTAATINSWYEENNQYIWSNKEARSILSDTLLTIEAGSKLAHAAIGEGLKKLYPGLITSYGAGYGVVITAISYNGFITADKETLDSLEYDIKRTRDYLLSVDEVEESYYRLQSRLIESTLDYYPDLTEEEKEKARDYLYDCFCFSDFIDYSESDLMDHIGRE